MMFLPRFSGFPAFLYIILVSKPAGSGFISTSLWEGEEGAREQIKVLW
jgi:hypothetical protein